MTIKRAKKTEEPTLSWRKIGGGTLTLKDGTEVKPNGIFKAKASDIPAAFMDTIQRVDNPTPSTQQPTTVETGDEATFSKVEVEGGWDVLDTAGAKQNEEPLTEEEADELIASLEEE